MKRFFQILFFCILVAGAFSVAWAQGYGYVWLTDRERAPDGTRHFWFHGDTICGDVRSNDTIAIMQDPVFCGRVISSAPDFWRGAGYNPHFLGPQPNFNAPRITFPTDEAASLRLCAGAQGNFFQFPGKRIRAYFVGSQARFYKWDTGTQFDPRDNWAVSLSTNPQGPSTCIFVDGPLEILGDTTSFGAFTGVVTIGASETISILDNIRYVHSSIPEGLPSPDCPDILFVVSEADIVIANTPANGRWNSGMPNGTSGYQQTNMNRTSITITALLFSTNGSFTFEQQNDPNDWYVCNCTPDDRGTIYLYGRIWQRQRGYLHRSTNSSTGYILRLLYDPRLPTLEEPRHNNTDTLDFGNVAVGATAWDTAHVYSSIPVNIGLVMTQYPYWATRPDPSYAAHFDIPVRFTPPRAERFVGSLSVSLPGNFLQIVLLGHGVHAAAPPLTMDIAPNPFNSTTLIRYTLQQASAVRLVLYDVLGRRVRDVISAPQEAGAQVVRVDASDLASGVYFARLEANGQRVMHKLMLLK